MNSDPDADGVPMINFCQKFFDKHSLGDAVIYGRGLNEPNNLKLANYDNRALTFLVRFSEASLDRVLN
jgi:hypothetical protein